MTIWDISVGIEEGLVVWPGEASVILEQTMTLQGGGKANVSRLACGVHTATHVDAPLHVLEGGGAVEAISFNALLGPAYVVELPGLGSITTDDLDEVQVPTETQRLLIKTPNSERWNDPTHQFHHGFKALTCDAARWVVRRGIQLLGVDYLSVQLFADESQTTHEILLTANVVLLEGLDLRGVEVGEYELICLPLKLMGCEGAPARAILRR